MMANQPRHVKGLEGLLHAGCTDWPTGNCAESIAFQHSGLK